MSDRVFHTDDFTIIAEQGNPRISGNYLVISNDNNIFVAYLNTVGDWTATGGKFYGDLHKERREVTHYLPGRLQVNSGSRTPVKFGKLVKASMVVPK